MRPLVLRVDQGGAPAGPLPPGTRYTFTRDSVLWSDAMSLADLLATLPGVYVARAGFVGQPEYVQYGGRGGSALEIYWDGQRVEPLGGDTLFLDPGRFPLTYLRRVDVEMWPAALRVYLVSERHELPSVRSMVRVNSGAFKTAAYTALFQRRWPSGLSLDLAGDFVGSDGPDQSAQSDQFDLWAKLGWLSDDGLGAFYQIRRQRRDREPRTVAGGGGVPERRGSRTDFLFALVMNPRDERRGLRAEGGIGVSRWSADSGSSLQDQDLRHAYASLQYAGTRWSVDLRARASDVRTPLELEGRLGWAPIPGVVLAGETRWRRHDRDRSSRAVYGSAGLYAGPVSLVGQLAIARAVQAPALHADTAVPTTDRSLRAGFDTRPLTTHVALVRRDAYAPLPYPDLSLLSALEPTPPATYLVADAQLRPVGALTLSGWFADPVSGTPADFQPPKHGRAAVTLRSKFWRTFRSGAFDLKVQVAMESWSAGSAGIGQDGTPIALPSATFYEFHLELQLVSFTAFWNVRNARLSDAQYVPGLVYPKYAQSFGGTWTFSN